MTKVVLSHHTPLAALMPNDLRPKLKALTRGRTVTLEGFAAFIDGLEVSEEVKKRLKSLSPETYTGIASTLARH